MLQLEPLAPGGTRWAEAQAAVRDGRRRRSLARAARRLPPKRCRIIDIGGPNATPVRRDPGRGCEPPAPPPGEVAPTTVARSAPDREAATSSPSAISHEVPPPAWNT